MPSHLIALVAPLFLLVGSICPCDALELAEPIEYVLQADGAVVPRDELAEPFEEKVEVRPDQNNTTNRWITKVKTASITLYLPEGKPTAAAVVFPGGAYAGHSFDNEGCRLAVWFAERGLAAGVLKYRTHIGKPLGDKPLRDAQAAVEFMKKETGLPVGAVGFSAGGHLAGMTANSPPADLPEGAEWLAFHAMMYPVTSMADNVTHRYSRKLTLGPSPNDEQKDRFSPYKLVTEATSPVFLVHTTDDKAVSYENSVLYFRACSDAGVDAEMHLYPTGGHGWGMRQRAGTLNGWKDAFEAWLVAKKLIKRIAADAG